MTLDLDTFLVALYTIVDDLYKANQPHSIRCGPKPIMSDSEILTLALCAQWLKLPERKLMRYVKAHWQAYFRCLLTQSQFNRRFHTLSGLLVRLVGHIHYQLESNLAGYEVLDCVPVPLMKRCRGEKAKLFSQRIANIGKGGSDQDWYYGVKLAVAVSPQGTISGFVIAPARTSDRWPAEYLLCKRHSPLAEPVKVEDLPPSHGKKRTGPAGAIWPMEAAGKANPDLYLVDRGFSGVWWSQHWEQAYQTRVVNPDSYQGDEAASLRRSHASHRQIIENVFEHLSHDLGLKQLGARSETGLLARIATKLLAFNLAIWLNKLLGRPTFAIATLFSY